MLTYHIEGPNADDLRAQIIRDWGAAPTSAAPMPRPAPRPAPQAAAEPVKKRRGRPPKSETAAVGTAINTPTPQPAVGNTGSTPATGSPAVAAAAADSPAVAAAGASLTPEQFKSKLQSLTTVEAHGLAGVVNLLAKHGYQKVNEVPASKYAEIATEADAMLVPA